MFIGVEYIRRTTLNKPTETGALGTHKSVPKMVLVEDNGVNSWNRMVTGAEKFKWTWKTRAKMVYSSLTTTCITLENNARKENCPDCREEETNGTCLIGCEIAKQLWDYVDEILAAPRTATDQNITRSSFLIIRSHRSKDIWQPLYTWSGREERRICTARDTVQPIWLI